MGEICAFRIEEFLWGEKYKDSIFRYALLWQNKPIICKCGKEIVFRTEGDKVDFLYFAYNSKDDNLAKSDFLELCLDRHAFCLREACPT